MQIETVFSPDRKYRYFWEIPLVVPGALTSRCVFLMLNPSTADEKTTDATIRRCIGFAEQWGYHRLQVVNLFARRSTDPKVLMQDADPIGEWNDDIIKSTVVDAPLTVCAWGVWGSLFGRAQQVRQLLEPYVDRVNLQCLGLTKGGEPKHPVRLAKCTELISY